MDTGGANKGDTDTAASDNGSIYKGPTHTDVLTTGVGNNKGRRC